MVRDFNPVDERPVSDADVRMLVTLTQSAKDLWGEVSFETLRRVWHAQTAPVELPGRVAVSALESIASRLTADRARLMANPEGLLARVAVFLENVLEEMRTPWRPADRSRVISLGDLQVSGEWLVQETSADVSDPAVAVLVALAQEHGGGRAVAQAVGVDSRYGTWDRQNLRDTVDRVWGRLTNVARLAVARDGHRPTLDQLRQAADIDQLRPRVQGLRVQGADDRLGPMPADLDEAGLAGYLRSVVQLWADRPGLRDRFGGAAVRAVTEDDVRHLADLMMSQARAPEVSLEARLARQLGAEVIAPDSGLVSWERLARAWNTERRAVAARGEGVLAALRSVVAGMTEDFASLPSWYRLDLRGLADQMAWVAGARVVAWRPADVLVVDRLEQLHTRAVGLAGEVRAAREAADTAPVDPLILADELVRRFGRGVLGVGGHGELGAVDRRRIVRFGALASVLADVRSAADLDVADVRHARQVARVLSEAIPGRSATGVVLEDLRSVVRDFLGLSAGTVVSHEDVRSLASQLVAVASEPVVLGEVGARWVSDRINAVLSGLWGVHDRIAAGLAGLPVGSRPGLRAAMAEAALYRGPADVRWAVEDGRQVLDLEELRSGLESLAFDVSLGEPDANGPVGTVVGGVESPELLSEASRVAVDRTDDSGSGGSSAWGAAPGLHGVVGAFQSVLRQEPRAIRAGLFVRSGLSDDGLLRDAARRISSRGDRFVVVARGDGLGGVLVDGRSVDARTLADVIRRSPHWDPDAGASVWLFACAVSPAFVKELKELLNSRVLHGVDGLTWIGPGTGDFVAMVTMAVTADGALRPLQPPTGRWVEHQPGVDEPVEHGPYAIPLDAETPPSLGLPHPVHLRAPVGERAAVPYEQGGEDLEEQVDPFEDLMQGFRREVHRLRAAPLPLPGGEELVAGLARPFAREGGDGWEGLAREVGLDVGADDFRGALRSLAELAREVGSAEDESAAVNVPGMQRLRVLIDLGFEDDRQGAAFYARTLEDLWGLVADLTEPVFTRVTGQYENPQPEDLPDDEVRHWIERMDVVRDLGDVRAGVVRIGADLVDGRWLLPIIRLAEQLYEETPDIEMLRGLAWLAGQLDPVSSNISWVSLAGMVAGFEGRAGRHASPSEVRDLVGLAGRAREVFGRLGSVQADVDADADAGQRVSPVQALEAMWNADQPWRRMGDRLAELEVTARAKHDEQMTEWAQGVLAGFEEARSVVVREPAESQARLNTVVNAVVLPSFVTRIAERFEGGWSGLAEGVGLGDGTELPADYRQSLENLAGLYWEIDPDLFEFDRVLLWMRRVRVLIDVGLEDGGEGAAFYKRTVDDLRSLVADASGPVFNLQTRQQELRPPGAVEVDEIRHWLELTDVVHDLGGYHKLVGKIGVDLVGGRRLFPVIRLAKDLYIETPDVETFHSLAWLASQLDAESSTISSLSSLARMVAGFEGRSAWDVGFLEVRDLVSLVGRAREDLGRVDGDPKGALEAMWNADQPWRRMGNRLAELTAPGRDEQMVEWARGLLGEFEDARSVVVREPAESEARLNAVVLTPFMTEIAERFGVGWSEAAAEIGLGDGTGLPADVEQSLLNLAELYWEVDPDLSGFDNALPWMRRVRMLIDAGFDDGKVGAAFYKRTVGELRSLAAELFGPVVNPQTGQQELRPPWAVGVKDIRRWLELMGLVDNFGGVGRVVGEIGADLVGGRRLFPVIRLAEELYGKWLRMETLRGLAWLANQLDPVSSNISRASLESMVAGIEGRADGYTSSLEVHRLVELAGRARELLRRVDGDPKKALEAIWKDDRRWEWTEDRLTEIVDTAPDEQTAEWATELLFNLDVARSVVVREPAESQARLNAVVLTPFVTKIAEQSEGGRSGLAAEIGLGDGTDVPADVEQSLLNLAELYWEIFPDLSGFDNALPGMRRVRMLIDAGFDDGREGAACYARTIDDLRRLVADLPRVNPQTGQDEPQSPGSVGVKEIRRWLERMDVVHNLGGYHALVSVIGGGLVGGRRLFPVVQRAEQLYGRWPEMETLHDVARELRVAEARELLQQHRARQAELATSLEQAESRQAELAALPTRNAGEGLELDSLRGRIGAVRSEIGELAGRIEAERGALEGLVSDARQERGQDDAVPRGRERTAEELTGGAELSGAGASSSAGADLRGAGSAGVSGAGVEGLDVAGGSVPGVEVIRAGIVASDVGEDVRAAVRELPLRDGRFVVVVRGDGEGGVVVDGRSVDARTLAGVIRRSSNWDPDAVVWLYACGVSEGFARALDEELGSGVRWTRDMVWFGPGTGGFASMVAGAYVGDGGRLLPVLPPNGRWESTRPDVGGQPEVGPYDLRLPEDQSGLRPDWVHLRAPVGERSYGQRFDDLIEESEENVDPLEDLMFEFWEEADRLRAAPLRFPGGEELVAGLARPFAREGGDGWEGLAGEVGLDVGADDFRGALRSLAELAWDVGFDGGESAAVDVPGMQRLRALIDLGFEDGRQGAAFYDRTLEDLRELVADLTDPLFNHVTGQHETPQPEDVSDAEVRRWIERMSVVLHLGGVGGVGADLVGGRRLFPVIRLAEQLYGATPDKTTFDGLAWLAGQLDPVSSNISWVTLTDMMAGFDGRAGRHASHSEMRDLVGLAGRARKVLGRLDSVQAHADAYVDVDVDGGQRVSPVQALEAMWNADKPWRLMGDRLAALTAPGRDEQMVEWARGLLGEFEDARSVVVREPAESQARLNAVVNAVVLPSFMARIAERFGGGWREVAAEVGLGDGTVLPADYRQSLTDLAGLYWEVDPDLSGFDEALLWMRRVRGLIDAGFDDGKVGAAFYKRAMGDLQSLAAELFGPVFNPRTGRQEVQRPWEVGVKEIRRWLELMDLVDGFGGVGRVVGAVGADLVGGRRLFPVIELAEELYGKRPGVEMLRGLAWLANQLDPVSSNISRASLARMAADFEGRADGYASSLEVHRLVELAGRAREVLGRKGTLEAIWKADRRWERTANRLAELETTLFDEGDDQTAEWATGLLYELEDEWSLVVGEPAESQARLNAVVLTPFMTKIAEGFDGGWSGLAAEVGVGDGAGLPDDARQSLVNLAGLYWEIAPALPGFDEAPLWMRRIRVLIDAGFDDSRGSAAFYALGLDDLRSLVADLSGPVFNPQTVQDEPRSPGTVEIDEIRRWLERMDVVHNVGGYRALVNRIGEDLVGRRRLFPVIRLAKQLYRGMADMETLHALAWLANQLYPESSNISFRSLAHMVAGFEGKSGGQASAVDLFDLVDLAVMVRKLLADDAYPAQALAAMWASGPVQALEAMWNADRYWWRMKDRLTAIEDTADEQTAEWADRVLFSFEGTRYWVVRETAESPARLNDVVLPSLVTRIAVRFNPDGSEGWEGLAREVGLGDGTGLPADARQSLTDLAGLYWEVDPDLGRFGEASLWMRRIRTLIDAGFGDRRGRADFYARPVDHLRSLVAELPGPVSNSSAGPPEPRSPGTVEIDEIRRWLELMDVVHGLGQRPRMETLHDLARLAHELDPDSSHVDLDSLSDSVRNSLERDHGIRFDEADMRHLVSLAGATSRLDGRLDSVSPGGVHRTPVRFEILGSTESVEYTAWTRSPSHAASDAAEGGKTLVVLGHGDVVVSLDVIAQMQGRSSADVLARVHLPGRGPRWVVCRVDASGRRRPRLVNEPMAELAGVPWVEPLLFFAPGDSEQAARVAGLVRGLARGLRGVQVVGVHVTEDGSAELLDGRRVTPEDFAEEMWKNEHFVPGFPLAFVGCGAFRQPEGGASFADRVAGALGTTADWGTDGDVWLTEDGSFHATKTVVMPDGRMLPTFVGGKGTGHWYRRDSGEGLVEHGSELRAAFNGWAEPRYAQGAHPAPLIRWAGTPGPNRTGLAGGAGPAQPSDVDSVRGALR